MDESLQRHFKVWIAASISAILCWMFVPRSAIDRLTFQSVANLITQSPVGISGNGSQHDPWRIITDPTSGQGANPSPDVIALRDDLEGFFQTSPHSPIDVAVVFSNMQRLGIRHLACAVVLAWDNPDPISLAALEKTIRRFDSLILAVPLSRGPTSEPMPEAVRRTSLDPSQVHGDTSRLPVVNRIPLPGMIFGDSPNTFAGFQVIESQPDSSSPYMLARWEDRWVPSFHLLALLQKLKVKPSQLQVEIGKGIRVADTGTMIPIDEYGRLGLPLEPTRTNHEIRAEELIDANADLFNRHLPEPLLFCDQRSNIDTESAAFNQEVATIARVTDQLLPETQGPSFPRVPVGWEITSLLLLSWILSLNALAGGRKRAIGLLLLLVLCVVSQIAIAATLHRWLPGIPATIITWVAALFSIKLPSRQHPNSTRLDFIRYPQPHISTDSANELP